MPIKCSGACENSGIDLNMVITFVERNCKEFNLQNRAILADNIKLALVQTATEHGVGGKRMKAIQNAMWKLSLTILGSRSRRWV